MGKAVAVADVEVRFDGERLDRPQQHRQLPEGQQAGYIRELGAAADDGAVEFGEIAAALDDGGGHHVLAALVVGDVEPGDGFDVAGRFGDDDAAGQLRLHRHRFGLVGRETGIRSAGVRGVGAHASKPNQRPRGALPGQKSLICGPWSGPGPIGSVGPSSSVPP
ncbi:hypothetical protein GCM10029992_63270 [Glycomyces albus]